MSAPPTTWLVVAHGSRAASTTVDHQAICDDLAAAAPTGVQVGPAYLEIDEPTIPDAIDAAVGSGSTRIVLLPYFLHAGNHTTRDLPDHIAAATARHPGVELVLARHLGPDPRLVAILADRAVEVDPA